MRKLTDLEIDRLAQLTKYSIELTLIELTETGLNKSIMDATASVRAYLKDRNIHDFGMQKKGKEDKLLVNACIILKDFDVPSKASLYRPITKNGDPRIWFTGLSKHANANDILGVIEFQGILFVLNITQLDLKRLLEASFGNPLKDLVDKIIRITNKASDELLAMLKIMSGKTVKGLLQADTSIGRTLETALGIKTNSNKGPDYKGIELKTFRAVQKNKKTNNRKTLFAQVPNWKLSKVKGSPEILNKFGYHRDVDFKLYCTVSTRVINSQGLSLKLDLENGLLREIASKSSIEDVVVWELKTLHERLLEKHNETFWISATTTIINGEEHFQFTKVEHTKKPIVSQFDILIEQGEITLDHLIKRSGKKVSEKGPLFKITDKGLKLLFPPSNIYHLK